MMAVECQLMQCKSKTMTNEITNVGPHVIEHVIGQKRAVQQLRVALSAHFNDRMSGTLKALPHVLLVGAAGCGKSLIAGIISQELGVAELHEELAQNIKSPGHMHGFLMMIEPFGCAFLDEIHETPPVAMTTLYRALEERRLFLGGDRKSVTLPEFTMLAATTDEWALSRSLRDRFRIVLKLTHYSSEELSQIVAQRAKQLGWPISNEAVREIALRGRNTPRLAIRLLEASRRTTRAVDARTITEGLVHNMCEVEGIDVLGLDSVERNYLNILREAQGAVRLNMISARLGHPRKTVEMLERDLIRMNLITKNEAGRMLTAEGAAHLSKTSKGLT